MSAALPLERHLPDHQAPPLDRHLPDHQAPPLAQLLREAGALVQLRWQSLRPPRVERRTLGNDHPVMVLPGFLSSDHSTTVLRRALEAAGYRVDGWGLGFNWGARHDLLERIEAQLASASRKEPVTLIGWSLGGLYAREVAKRQPDKVARVITLGSPFSGDLRANHAWRLYEMINGHKVDRPPIEVRVSEKPPVPTIALWSRADGIVAPACARGEPHECDEAIEVECSHMGFMTAPCAIQAVLDVLAR
jgi:pimeloyl-ACP methyl ester carboxylesterase